MRIKSYFARTVEDAMAMARSELGPDAMLVNSRKAPEETWHLGEYEVVFAAEAVPEPGESAGSGRTASGVSPQPVSDRLSDEVAELKRELEGMRRALMRSALAPSPWMASSPDIGEAYAALTANDVLPELAREIVQCAAGRIAGPTGSGLVPDTAAVLRVRSLSLSSAASLERAVAEEVESRIVAEPHLGRGDGHPRITALVGPPGCGKTTTLVKLAVNYGLAARRPALLLSMDTYRVAAAEQLRSYAAILGVGFQVLETAAGLSQAIAENRGKELIFIDTPGFSGGDMDHAASLAKFLAGRSDIDTQLVLSSSMKSADLTRMVDLFEVFRPQRLLFTRLDETGSFGPILNEAVRTRKPLSFFCAGQRIPEDLEEVTHGRVAELVLTGRPARARSAA